jgi:type IV pilus biogenesis protein CpaD/CtpE
VQHVFVYHNEVEHAATHCILTAQILRPKGAPNASTANRMKSDMRELRITRGEGPGHVMLAVNDSGESAAAVQWAVENLIHRDDKVVLFHAVKTRKKIPTASKWLILD